SISTFRSTATPRRRLPKPTARCTPAGRWPSAGRSTSTSRARSKPSTRRSTAPSTAPTWPRSWNRWAWRSSNVLAGRGDKLGVLLVANRAARIDEQPTARADHEHAGRHVECRVPLRAAFVAVELHPVGRLAGELARQIPARYAHRVHQTEQHAQ